MVKSDILVFTDKNVTPSDDLIFSIIGDKKALWKEIMHHVQSSYKDITGQWNYYNDGKLWLYKLTHKKKTIFWIGVLNDTFRVTFYFGDKAENLIDASDLPQTIKDGFKTGKRYGKIRAVSIKMNDRSDVDNVLKLIAIKFKIK